MALARFVVVKGDNRVEQCTSDISDTTTYSSNWAGAIWDQDNVRRQSHQPCLAWSHPILFPQGTFTSGWMCGNALSSNSGRETRLLLESVVFAQLSFSRPPFVEASILWHTQAYIPWAVSHGSGFSDSSACGEHMVQYWGRRTCDLIQLHNFAES